MSFDRKLWTRTKLPIECLSGVSAAHGAGRDGHAAESDLQLKNAAQFTLLGKKAGIPMFKYPLID